jgi:hypothetical protein
MREHPAIEIRSLSPAAAPRPHEANTSLAATLQLASQKLSWRLQAKPAESAFTSRLPSHVASR